MTRGGAEPLPIGATKWVAVDEVTTVSVRIEQGDEVAVVLRRHGPPVVGRDEDGEVLVRLRPHQAAELIRALTLVCYPLTVKSR